MLPIRLKIENFYCHSKSEIDFNDFSSAVIVGKINKDDNRSNGSGKSTIFAAIKYVLFNEVDTSSLDKVIKHNEKYCKVIFDFQSSLDGQTYRIARFRGKKPGTDVRVYKWNGVDWDDLTQRTSTETEKEILKILKINYKTFSNSVLFSQGDLSGIAAMTPKERKVALKEALQLGVYSKYETMVKKKIGDLVKELEKSHTLVGSLGNPKEDIVALKNDIITISPKKQTVNENIKEYNKDIEEVNKEIYTKQKELDNIVKNNQERTEKLSQTKKECFELENDLTKIVSKLNIYDNAKREISKKLDQLNIENQKLINTPTKSISLIQEDINKYRNTIAENQAQYKILIKDLQDLRIPLSEDAVCKHCRQAVDKSAREACKINIDKDIVRAELEISRIKANSLSLMREEEELNKQLSKAQNHLETIKKIELEIEKEGKNLSTANALIIEFQPIKNDKEKSLSNKKMLLDQLLLETKKTINTSNTTFLTEEIKVFISKISQLTSKKEILMDQYNSLSNQEAVVLHRIEQRSEDAKKIEHLSDSINKLEYQHILHQKVLAAFGSNGIPALITHTILDDYQIEANNLLNQIRPGLQLQFLIEKDRSDGELTDTLDIVYLLNDAQLEFAQLSGAQKLLVALSLKLGLAAIIRKRLGVDLKMILIDEADQSLDAAALETFEQAIKQLQKDYKILVITHNNDLKNKFNYAIVVEQDEHLNSTATVMNGGW